MSKATNNTQRVTFCKTEYFAASATRAIIFDDHIVGEIVKGGEGCGYDVVLFVDAGRDNASDRSHNRCFEMAFDGIRYEHWSIALNAAKEYAIATLGNAEIVRTHERSGGRGVTGWIKITQEPAQAETVETVRAMANEDGESVSLECPACDRVVATVTPANVGPSSYTRACKCGRRTRHDVTLTITQDDRIRVARWGMVATNVGHSKRQWVQTDRGMEWRKVFIPAEAHA